MKITSQWYDFYELLYGSKFSRILLTGTAENGFEKRYITSVDDISKSLEENYTLNDYYISLYDYDADNSIIQWDNLDSQKYIDSAINKVMLLRFRIDKKSITEETYSMSSVEKFMFIRRTMNLGFTKKLFNDVEQVQKLFKDTFNVTPLLIYNGYDECYLYIYFSNNIKLDNPLVVYYGLQNFIMTSLDISTFYYSSVTNPFSQLVSLPGSQLNDTRLYIKPFDAEEEYYTILKKSENIDLEYTYEDIINQDTSLIESKLKELDKKITELDKENSQLSAKHLTEIFLDE
ncbi:MAG: hypothetical protein LUG89_00475 [Methanosphaera sp.]|nr:hypothetical protein [Methanosphaera sp.]